MVNGLSVEEIVKLVVPLEEEETAAEMIQLNMAMESVGEVAKVTDGSQFQLEGLEVQLVEVVSRKVWRV